MRILIMAFDYKNHLVKLTIMALVLVSVVLSWLGFLDTISQDYIDGAIVQSTVAFGVARGLNALVSVLQSTEVSFQLGTGISVAIGEVLDPINDLIEQYSSLMKMAIGSLIIQKLLIEIVSDFFFKVLITLSGLAVVASFFYQKGQYSNRFAKTFVFLFFIRFMLVIVVLLNGVVDRAFIEDKVEHEITTLESLSHEVDKQSDPSNTLTATEKQVLPEHQAMLQKQIVALQEANAIAIQKRDHYTSQLTQIEMTIEEYKQGLGLDRYNPFYEDATLQGLYHQAAEIDVLVKLAEMNRVNTLKQAEEVEKQIIEIENRLQGQPNGIFESTSQMFSQFNDTLSTLKSNMDVVAVKDRLEASVSNMLNVMTLFLFKTMILPLIFLLLLIKGTNLIWNIDVRQKIQDESEMLLKNQHAS